jgi:ketosteroid isomerase-like protein
MESVRSRREAVVREHMEAENRHDFDAVIATFAHPRCELIATGQVHDGEDEVRGYFAFDPRCVPRPAQRARGDALDR